MIRANKYTFFLYCHLAMIGAMIYNCKLDQLMTNAEGHVLDSALPLDLMLFVNVLVLDQDQEPSQSSIMYNL